MKHAYHKPFKCENPPKRVFEVQLEDFLYLFALFPKKVHFALTSAPSQYGLESCNSPALTSQLRLGTNGLQDCIVLRFLTLHWIWLILWIIPLVVKLGCHWERLGYSDQLHNWGWSESFFVDIETLWVLCISLTLRIYVRMSGAFTAGTPIGARCDVIHRRRVVSSCFEGGHRATSMNCFCKLWTFAFLLLRHVDLWSTAWRCMSLSSTLDKPGWSCQ